jgi:hypothetical protein
MSIWKQYFRNLKTEASTSKGRFLLSLSILIPLFIFVAITYLYFLPFGYSKNIDSQDFKTINNQYESQIKHLTYSPIIKKINLNATITTREDLYFIPKVLKEKNSHNTSTFQHTLKDPLFINNRYLELDNLTLDIESPIIVNLTYSFPTGEDLVSTPPSLLEKVISKIPFFALQEEESKNIYEKQKEFEKQLILKYKNLRFIQDKSSVILSLEESDGTELRTYEIKHEFDEDVKGIHNLTAVYLSSQKDIGGGLIFYVDNKITGLLGLEPKFSAYDSEDILFDKNFLEDTQQDFISLGQEKITKEMLKSLDNELINSIDFFEYYLQKKYDGAYRGNDLLNYPEYFLQDPLSNKIIQHFYPKTFYRFFEGNIYDVKISNDLTTIFPSEVSFEIEETPIEINIFGNIDKSNFQMILEKKSIWEK